MLSKGVYRQIVSHVIEPELIKILHGNTVRNRNWNDFGIGIRVHAASQSRLFLYTHTFFIYIYCMQLCVLYVWFRLLPAATRHKSSWHSANCHFIANSCGQQGYQRHRWSCQLAIAVRDWLLVVTLALNTNYDRPWRPWTASILRPFGSIGGC